MILKPLRPNCEEVDENGGGTAPAPAPQTKPENVAKPRQPTKEELEVEFDASGIVDDGDEGAPSVESKQEKKQEPKKDELPEGKKKVEFVATDKKGQEKKVELAATPKPEEKKAPEPVAPVKPSKTIVPISARTEKPVAPSRDYSGFSDEEVRVLKAMSNDAFEYTSKLIRERKEVEKLKDATFLQHPLAYTLDPQYQKLQEDLQYFTKEAQYWQEQLVAIADGKKWRPITGWNKDGTPIFGNEQAPTKLAEEQIRMVMNQCFGAAQQSNAQLQQLPGNYQQRIQQDITNIKKEFAERFGWVADPKQLDSEVEILTDNGPVNKKIREVHQDFLNLWPPYLRNTLGVDAAAHMFVALHIYAQENRLLQAGKQVAEIKVEEATRIEPTSVETVKKQEEIDGVKEFSMEGMPSL